MCGISAVYKYSSVTQTDKEKLLAMNEEMHYRGPDDRGVWSDEKCGLAQVRLSIIGLQKGKQPLFNEDKSLVLVCNGEIYNYVEIKDALIAKGHVFNSDSDSETIIHLYEEYGVNCLDHLRGMFAFCLWDIKKKQLFAARDRIGEKTLYYSQIPCGVVISTELKAILKNYTEQPVLNFKQLASPIRYTSPTSDKETFIDQINRVEPGQFILVNEHGVQKTHYWKRDLKESFGGSFEDARVRTLEIMRESVNICLRSDVPVAVMLSGGIDSSAVAALAKESGREVHTITAGYKGSYDCDERGVAQKFAREKGFIYHEIELDENDFKDCFDELTQYIDEPITDAAAVAQWALYKKVKQLGFKVLLGGMGGDELFYGYPYWNKLGESLRMQRTHQSFFPWKGLQKKKDFLQFFLKNWKSICMAGYPMMINDRSIGAWQYDDYKKFASDSEFLYKDAVFKFSELDLNYSFGNAELGREIDTVYEFSFNKIMTMAYLYLSDRLGMGNSLEIRSPLLDYKLVEFVSGIPLHIKYNPSHPKYFLKKVVEGIVPDYILYATKKGFTPPSDFISKIVSDYSYKSFTSNHKYYNSILADRLLSLQLK